MPVIGPALPVVQTELGINNREIGWIVMSSYTLPGLFFVPFTGYLADRFGKKVGPTSVASAICHLRGSNQPGAKRRNFNWITLFQGVGACALSTLNTTLIPDLFSGRNRVEVIGYVGVTQDIGSGLLPLIGGLLSSITWYLPFTTALIALPVGIYVLLYLDNAKPDLSQRSANYLSRAWQSLADRRVIELCFFLSDLFSLDLAASYLTSHRS